MGATPSLRAGLNPANPPTGRHERSITRPGGHAMSVATVHRVRQTIPIAPHGLDHRGVSSLFIASSYIILQNWRFFLDSLQDAVYYWRMSNSMPFAGKPADPCTGSRTAHGASVAPEWPVTTERIRTSA